ncbi:hypothetical protein BRC62_00135 [Halobacteriales archaeon QH_10_67_13]|nr:MAG: hypothetical protein BRC62_00135 [Halobacteriales archaeon QH_10_67_13]
MARDTGAGTDAGLGLAMLAGLVAVAAVVTAVTGALAIDEGGETLQLTSGVGLAVSLLASGLALVVIHTRAVSRSRAAR